MVHFLKAQVKNIQPDSLKLELPGGVEIDWPRDTEDEHLQKVAVGDELTLTLTKTINVINELLNNHNDGKG
ncbi:hypothetical protein ACFL2M_00330 [Patescibacteria group bacterium]